MGSTETNKMIKIEKLAWYSTAFYLLLKYTFRWRGTVGVILQKPKSHVFFLLAFQNDFIVQQSRSGAVDRPWNCHKCGKGFCSRTTLRKHVAAHDGIYPYKCEYCDKGSTNPVHMKEHMSMHTNINYFQCADCDATFRLKKHLDNHRKAVHSSPSIQAPTAGLQDSL